jgi:hypothetical protein
VLLIFSLAYAGWVGVRQERAGRRHEVGVAHLLALAAAVAIATFLVRLAIPLGGSNRYVTLNLWEWPACISLFALGVTTSTNGWLTAVPDRLRRHSRTATLTALAAFAVFAASAGTLGVVDDEQLWGSWRWPALVFAIVEAVTAVFGPVWLLAAAQRHLDQQRRWAGPVTVRSAYGAFVLQAPVLIGLAIVLRPVPLPAEVKALVVGAAGVAGSFALAWLLISRIPGVSPIL